MYDDMLYDDVHKWTYVPLSRLDNLTLNLANLREPKLKEGFDAQQRVIRERLRKANRFVMDDEFTRIAVAASHEYAKVPTWINLARLPYPNVWIEWDQHVKVAASHAAGKLQTTKEPNLDLVSQRGGFLLHEIDSESGAWVAQRWEGRSGTKGGDATVSDLGWIVMPEGDATMRYQPPAPYETLVQYWGDALNKQRFHPETLECWALGFDMRGMQDADLSNHPQGKLYQSMVEVARNRLVTVVDPNLLRLRANACKYLSPDALERTELAATRSLIISLEEDRGLVRILIAVLALLNEAPNVRHVAAPRAGYRYMGMHRLPYLGHSTVHVQLPKSKPITALWGLLDRASKDRRRNRAHLTRGHWRQVEYGKLKGLRCDHIPTLVENGLGICTKCERMVRWIPSHQRGDAALGWVTHDYVLEGKAG